MTHESIAERGVRKVQSRCCACKLKPACIGRLVPLLAAARSGGLLIFFQQAGKTRANGGARPSASTMRPKNLKCAESGSMRGDIMFPFRRAAISRTDKRVMAGLRHAPEKERSAK